MKKLIPVLLSPTSGDSGIDEGESPGIIGG